ncbi:hypothetical protein ACFFRR_003877 [Megaselia abdita]
MSEEMQKSRAIVYPIPGPERQLLMPEIQENVLINSKSTYMFVTESKLQTNCKALRTFEVQNVQLCNSASFKQMNARESKNSIKIPTRGFVKLNQVNSFRIRLKNENSFLFYFRNTESIFSLCDGNAVTTKISGVGICSLNDSCVHTLNNAILKTSSKVQVLLPPLKEKLQIEWDQNPIEQNNNTTDIETLHFNSTIDLEEYISKIKNNFADLNDTATKLQEKERQSQLIYGNLSVSSLTLFGLGIVVILFCIKSKKKSLSNGITINTQANPIRPSISVPQLQFSTLPAITNEPTQTTSKPPLPPKPANIV